LASTRITNAANKPKKINSAIAPLFMTPPSLTRE
jgi:hypothetical protein